MINELTPSESIAIHGGDYLETSLGTMYVLGALSVVYSPLLVAAVGIGFAVIIYEEL